MTIFHEPLGFDFRVWFNKILPTLIKAATGMVKEDREHSPMLMVFGYGVDDVVPMLMPEPFDGAIKDHAAALQQTLASRVDRVAAVVLVVEAWTIRSDKDLDVDREYEKYESLADHPNRIEAVMFNAIHGQEQLIAICDIDRKKRRLGKPKIIDQQGGHDQRFTGRFAVDPPTKQ